MPTRVPFPEAVRLWAKVAALSFGGPAGQIAVMHRMLVEEKRWISEERFLHALNYCMLLPGPEAQQLAIYIGWLLNGTCGGLVAGILFVLPGFVAILGAVDPLRRLRGSALVAALFFGLKPAVLAVVAEAVVRVGRRALEGPLPGGPRRAGLRRHLLLRGAVPADRRRGGDRRLLWPVWGSEIQARPRQGEDDARSPTPRRSRPPLARAWREGARHRCPLVGAGLRC